MLGVHASPQILPENTHLVYPLSDVAKLSCRPNVWSTMDPACITKLPIIHGANYSQYKDNKEYTFNYTVLWRGTYYDGRDPQRGAHPWVDIASVQWTPLYALADGTVYFAGWQNGYGNVVKIRFRYWGNIYYAVYAHTNKIFVKKGQSVSMGQKIAEVGNTGMTFWWGGGYHVHFEINKEKHWRLEYYLTGCPDKSVGDFGIVDKGLCRKEIWEHQVDPIALLESAGATLVKTAYDRNVNNATPNQKSTTIKVRSEENSEEVKNDDVKAEEGEKEKTPGSNKEMASDPGVKSENTWEWDVRAEESSEEIKKGNKKSEESAKEVKKDGVKPKKPQKASIHTTSTVKKQSWDNASMKDDPYTGQETPNNQTKKSDETITSKTTKTPESTVHNAAQKEDSYKKESTLSSTYFSDEDIITTWNMISLDLDTDNELVRHFLNLYDIKAYSSFWERSTLWKESKEKIIFTIVEKSSATPFSGILPLPLSFMTSNGKTQLSYNQVSLIKDGKATIDITFTKTGKSAILLMVDTQRLAALKYTIQ